MSAADIAWPAEVELVIACGRCRLNSAESARVERLLRAGLDWDLVLRTADAHGLTSLLSLHLLDKHWDGVPAAARQGLDRSFKRVARQNLALSAELLNAMKVLADRGIDAVPYKGAVLAETLYGNLALREFSDVDLFVHPADAERACMAMLDAGYQPEYQLTAWQQRTHLRAGCDLNLRSPASDARIELHWQATAYHYGIRFDVEGAWSRLQRASIGGKDVPTFAPEDLLLLLAIHGGKHAWSRIAWVCDVAELLRTNPQLDWNQVLDRTRAAHASRYVLLAVTLAQELHGAAVPQSLREASGSSISPLLRKVLDSYAQGLSELQSQWSRWSLILALQETRTARLQALWRYALIPDPMDWEWVRLPRGLTWLHPPLRVLRLALARGRLQTGKIFQEARLRASAAAINRP